MTATVDLEDGPGGAPPGRALARLLDLLDEAGAAATVFVVGEVAAREPGLVREVAARGHEVGLHGERHLPLERLSPAALREEAARGRARLEDLTGRAVLGFRAPLFSLTPAVPWAPEALRAAGFAYSSSVLPARSPLRGWPGAPRRGFVWPSGLVELPVPLAPFTPLGPWLPILGGMTLRSLPARDLRRLSRRVEGGPLWLHCHPYDLDGEAGVGGGLVGRVLRAGRGATEGRLRALLRGRAAAPLGERLGEIR